MSKIKIEQIFNTIFISLLFILIIGIPLIFTPLTRSVFEVNKLLLLRIITIIIYSLWLFRYILFKSNGIDNQKEESYSFLSFRWQKIGLEIPLMLWIGINILSTIFSQNIYIAIIGAYDRWEGIITIINYVLLILMYAKLVTKPKYLFWLSGGIIGSTFLSSAYGIFQSLGYDFMNWSVDPTQRVFACINNPVHFCAYVGMVVPLGLGFLLYITDIEQKLKQKSLYLELIKWALFAGTVIIYYAQFLSYSRATWMGFIAAMTLFYLLAANQFKQDTQSNFLKDFAVTSAGIACFYLTNIFHLDQKQFLIGAILWVGICAYILWSFVTTKAYQEDAKQRLYAYAAIIIIYLAFLFDISMLQLPTGWIANMITAIYYILLSAGLLQISRKAQDNTRYFLGKLILILIFAKLQFVAISISAMFLYGVLIGCYYFLTLKGNETLLREKKYWLIIFLAIFGLVLIVPTIPSYIEKLMPQKETTSGVLKATENAEGKVESYKNVAIQGTARTSMWKSAIPWIKDYWLLGSGPDTVKYMYPIYRRPEYGKLEGGHNFTPDRLHNEYLNTLATRGLIGSAIYYIGIIIGWYLLILKGLYKIKKNPLSYILISFIAGVTVYLGQVLFNFGVVATLFLFYTLMGLAMAMISYPSFQKDSNDTTNAKL